MSGPHLRINCPDPTEDSCPGRISDCVLTTSRTRISSPLTITPTQRPWHDPTQECDCRQRILLPTQSQIPSKRFEQVFPKTNSTHEACPRKTGQVYPLIRPGPGDNPTIYPPFLAPARRGSPEGRIPKFLRYLKTSRCIEVLNYTLDSLRIQYIWSP